MKLTNPQIGETYYGRNTIIKITGVGQHVLSYVEKYPKDNPEEKAMSLIYFINTFEHYVDHDLSRIYNNIPGSWLFIGG